MPRYYFDVNANAPIAPAVQEFLQEQFSNHAGNAASLHYEGRAHHHLIEHARQTISIFFANFYEVIFTASATEANNLFIHHLPADAVLLLSHGEHPSLREPALMRQAGGLSVEFLPINKQGLLDTESLEQRLAHYQSQPNPIWVSVQAANSETGIIQDYARIYQLTQNYGAYYHCDMVQLLGKKACHFETIMCDILTLSAHKIGGLLGAGALLHHPNISIVPQILGGAQEHHKRAGTQNHIAIAAFALALSRLSSYDSAPLLQKREALEQGLMRMGSEIIGYESPRLDNTVFALHPKLESQQILMQLDLAGIAASAGSACASGKIESSAILRAMGYDEEQAKSAVRFSFDASLPDEAIAHLLTHWCP